MQATYILNKSQEAHAMARTALGHLELPALIRRMVDRLSLGHIKFANTYECSLRPSQVRLGYRGDETFSSQHFACVESSPRVPALRGGYLIAPYRNVERYGVATKEDAIITKRYRQATGYVLPGSSALDQPYFYHL
ncbi:unnamed protein product [Penicillium roqueforti FM164]|uniref:Genomic scaffold, ProqFM164S02 n=1 Tax=Penicillium roqueforti (strain FM164) TaxID=1365484 RepID=W6Q7I5_PENRF|nr:unnamed protein product [Penicillium roqueforti FM164]